MDENKKNNSTTSFGNSFINTSLSSIRSPNSSKKKKLKRNSSLIKINLKKNIDKIEKEKVKIRSLNSSPNKSKRSSGGEFFLPKIPTSKTKKNSKSTSNSIPIKKSPKIEPQLYRISFTSSFHKSNEIKKNNKKSPKKKKNNKLILPLTKATNKNSNSNDSNKKLNS